MADSAKERSFRETSAAQQGVTPRTGCFSLSLSEFFSGFVWSVGSGGLRAGVYASVHVLGECWVEADVAARQL